VLPFDSAPGSDRLAGLFFENNINIKPIPVGGNGPRHQYPEGKPRPDGIGMMPAQGRDRGAGSWFESGTGCCKNQSKQELANETKNQKEKNKPPEATDRQAAENHFQGRR
jgi:hypothetical protein